jgi:hypothetical protein
LTYPVIADPQGDIFRRFGAAVPYHVLIDRDFRIALSTGEFEKDSLIGAIEEVMKSSGGKRNNL